MFPFSLPVFYNSALPALPGPAYSAHLAQLAKATCYTDVTNVRDATNRNCSDMDVSTMTGRDRM